MEQSVAASVPCVFTTQNSDGQQVVVTQVQLPQEQVQAGSTTMTTSFQTPTSMEGAALGIQTQEGMGSIPAVQQAIYQTENTGNVAEHASPEQFQGQLPTSYFSTTSIEGMLENNSPVNISPTSYDAVTTKLNSLFTNELSQMQSITDEHWKVQEFPLARIKKIMRMDEDVRMISAEVPVMLSKALELFITELSLRAWLQTEESKRRTVQRSDIAMAITKNDMFDFLIDIVPREEIQLRSKTTQKSTDGGGGGGGVAGESLQLLPPELLQMCIQQLAQQALSTSAAEGGMMEDDTGIAGSDSSDSGASAGLLQQQLQLLQQLMQIQQLQQEQQLDQTSPGLGDTVQLQHPPLLEQAQATNTSTQGSTSLGAAAGLDTQVLYSSVSDSSTAAGGGGAAGIQFTTALEQLTSVAAANQTILSIQQDQQTMSSVSSAGVNFTNGSQHTLHHVDPDSMAFHPHQPHELLQQPGSQSATVIIQSPLLDDVSASNQTPETTVTTLLDSGQPQFQHHQQLQHMSLGGDQAPPLVTSDGQVAANLQHHLVHHVLVDPSGLDQTSTGGHFQLTGSGGGGDVGVASSIMQTQTTTAVSIDGGVEFGSGSLTLRRDGLPSTTDNFPS